MPAHIAVAKGAGDAGAPQSENSEIAGA